MSNLERLLEIMARLRDPAGGCPWDLEQDFDTISPFTIEEAYEVDEAIASGDPEALRDELGDLLFQVVFQARIGQEKGLFDFEGVAEAICDKLVRRHPHVFAEAAAPGTSAAQLESWEEIKAAERAAAGQGDDPFAGVPRALPALARSAKLRRRIERATPDLLDLPARAAEGSGASEASDAAEDDGRSAETRAIASARSVLARLETDGGSGDASTRQRAIGEGLRAWVALARAFDVDPERALREADDAVVVEVRARLARGQAGDAPTR